MDDGEISKLQDLAREIQKIVNMKLEAYPVVIGALGMMPAWLQIIWRKLESV